MKCCKNVLEELSMWSGKFKDEQEKVQKSKTAITRRTTAWIYV